MSYTVYAVVPITSAVAKDLSRPLKYLCQLVVCHQCQKTGVLPQKKRHFSMPSIFNCLRNYNELQLQEQNALFLAVLIPLKLLLERVTVQVLSTVLITSHTSCGHKNCFSLS